MVTAARGCWHEGRAACALALCRSGARARPYCLLCMVGAPSASPGDRFRLHAAAAVEAGTWRSRCCSASSAASPWARSPPPAVPTARTPRTWPATNPSDLTVLTGLLAGPPRTRPATTPSSSEKIAALPGVRHVASYAGLNVAILRRERGSRCRAPYARRAAAWQPGRRVLHHQPGHRGPGTAARPIPRPGRDRPSTPREPRRRCASAPSPSSGSTPTRSWRSCRGQAAPTPAARQRVTVVGAVVYSAEETQDDIDTQRDGGGCSPPR